MFNIYQGKIQSKKKLIILRAARAAPPYPSPCLPFIAILSFATFLMETTFLPAAAAADFVVAQAADQRRNLRPPGGPDKRWATGGTVFALLVATLLVTGGLAALIFWACKKQRKKEEAKDSAVSDEKAVEVLREHEEELYQGLGGNGAAEGGEFSKTHATNTKRYSVCIPAYSSPPVGVTSDSENPYKVNNQKEADSGTLQLPPATPDGSSRGGSSTYRSPPPHVAENGSESGGHSSPQSHQSGNVVVAR